MRKFLVSFLGLLLFLLPLQTASAGAVLAVSASAQQVRPGDIVTLTASVSDIVSLYGFEIHLRFDPALLQVSAVEEGKAATPGSLLEHDFVAQNVFDNGGGTVDYAATQINPHEPVSGSGALLQVQFRAVAAGTARVDIGSFILSDIDGMALAATAAGAEVTVTNGAGAAPTAGESSPVPATPTAPSVTTPAEAPTVAVPTPEAVATPGAVATTALAGPEPIAPAPVLTAAAPRSSQPVGAVVSDPTGVAAAAMSPAAAIGSADALEAVLTTSPGDMSDVQNAQLGSSPSAATSTPGPAVQRVARAQPPVALAEAAPALAPPSRLEVKASSLASRSPAGLLAGGVGLLLLSGVLGMVAWRHRRTERASAGTSRASGSANRTER